MDHQGAGLWTVASSRDTRDCGDGGPLNRAWWRHLTDMVDGRTCRPRDSGTHSSGAGSVVDRDGRGPCLKTESCNHRP